MVIARCQMNFTVNIQFSQNGTKMNIHSHKSDQLKERTKEGVSYEYIVVMQKNIINYGNISILTIPNLGHAHDF